MTESSTRPPGDATDAPETNGGGITCPSCGKTSPATVRFCSSCGTHLAASPPTGPQPTAADFHALAPQLRTFSFKEKLMMKLADDPRWLASLLRAFWPIARIGKVALVTRYDDVMEVFSRDADFPVPWTQKFIDLDYKHQNFILGMPDDATYRAQRAHAMRIFTLADLTHIGAIAAERAEALIAQCHGEIDCMAGLLTQVTIDIVEQYFGIHASEPDFALWLHTLNLSSFPHPAPNPATDKLANIAKLLVGPHVDATIQRAKAAPDSRTILGRFLLAQKDDPAVLTDDVIRATMIGFMLGFIPTNNRCNGQIMEFLLRRPDAMTAAVAAARSGDDDLLYRVLFEALRFRPLFLGPTRTCTRDQVIAAGTPREARIPAGTMLMISTFSASFDPRRVPNPNKFDPDRGVGDAMRFGWGQHWCIGYGIAIAQITNTFKPLLVRGNIRRAAGKRGQPAYFGPFYEHLYVTYGQ